jgi:1-acyl-sn-glycerol-3-phosphate acyltransferase
VGKKVMNPLFKLFGIDKSFSVFDGNVGKLGWVSACKKLTSDLQIKVNSNKIKIPSKGSVLIYSNHPTGIDPYLLTAAIGRSDSYFWGDMYQSKKGKNISSHIIVVAPQQFWTIIKRPLTNWPGYIYMRLVVPSKSKRETKIINKKAIEKTVTLLKNGHQVIIFPSGGEYEFLPKKKGLSRVVDECKNRNIKVNIYEVKIEKFGELSLLSHFITRSKIQAVLSYTKIR